MDMNANTDLFVQAIDPARLDVLDSTGSDSYGNRLHPFAATGQAATATSRPAGCRASWPPARVSCAPIEPMTR
jgi:hypothetical protein